MRFLNIARALAVIVTLVGGTPLADPVDKRDVELQERGMFNHFPCLHVFGISNRLSDVTVDVVVVIILTGGLQPFCSGYLELPRVTTVQQTITSV